MHVSAIIAAGGRGLRFGGPHPKQLARLAGQSVLRRSVEPFRRSLIVNDLVVVAPPDLVDEFGESLAADGVDVEVVAGGPRRRDSVASGFRHVAARAEIVVIHDAVRPLVSPGLIQRTVAAAAECGAAIAALPVRDTVKRVTGENVAETLRRDEIYLAQTPQAFRSDVLTDALRIEGDATDEATLAEQAGHRVRIIEGDPRNVKITTTDDLLMAERLIGTPPGMSMRIGNGYDLHRLVEGRRLVLGGVTISHDKGLHGHSDGDAVCHAVTDALLGATAAGDIGRRFPDSDPEWKDADSLDLLGRVARSISTAGFTVVNVDVVVIAESPRLAPHVGAMRVNLAHALACEASRVSVKGKTNEGVDSMGAGESIAVHAVALVCRVR